VYVILYNYYNVIINRIFSRVRDQCALVMFRDSRDSVFDMLTLEHWTYDYIELYIEIINRGLRGIYITVNTVMRCKEKRLFLINGLAIVIFAVTNGTNRERRRCVDHGY